MTNQSSNTVSVIDIATETVTQTISVGTDPVGIAIRAPNKIYVTNAGSDSVSVIDASTSEVTATVNVGNYPNAAAVTPNGGAVYIANENSNTVSVVDTLTDQVTATIAVGTNPASVAITPDGARAYVGNIGSIVGSPNPNNQGSGSITVIDTATNSVTASVALNGAGALAVTPDRKSVYVIAEGRNVAVISTETNTVTSTIPLQMGGGADIAISPDGAFAYISVGGSFGGIAGGGFPGAVLVIQMATGQVVGSTVASAAVSQMALTPDGMSAFVTDYEFGVVRVFDTKSRAFTNQITIGNGLTSPAGMAIGCMAK